MKNHAVFISALICISLFSGCEKPSESSELSEIASLDMADTVSSITEASESSSKNNEIIPNERNTLLGESINSITFQKYDGKNITEQVIFDEEALNEIQSMISAVSAEKAEKWSPGQVKLPVYGFKIIDGDGADLEAAWSDGYWITQNGEAYSFDFDFEVLRNSYEWKYENVWDHNSIVGMPCAFFLCRDESGWITDYIETAEESVEIPENITAELADQNDEVLTIRLSNNSDDKDGSGWLYGESFRIDFFDGEWYPVPCMPGKWNSPRGGLVLLPGESVEITCWLNMYGELPSGKYRVVGDHFAVEFTV